MSHSRPSLIPESCLPGPCGGTRLHCRLPNVSTDVKQPAASGEDNAASPAAISPQASGDEIKPSSRRGIKHECRGARFPPSVGSNANVSAPVLLRPLRNQPLASPHPLPPFPWFPVPTQRSRRCPCQPRINPRKVKKRQWIPSKGLMATLMACRRLHWIWVWDPLPRLTREGFPHPNPVEAPA